jgi:predicted secreted Zn-dependent protease
MGQLMMQKRAYAGGVMVMAMAMAMLTAGAPSGAAVTEEVIQKPYAVRAQPDQTLRQAINAATPINVNGRKFHGYTRWNVRWTFRWWNEPSGRCKITEVSTRLRLELQLPDLQLATPSQQAEFDRYLPALSHHEQGHMQFGRDAARAIDQGIAQLPEEAECSTLERRANELGHSVLRDHVEREKQYDAKTGHGATQGAKLK